MCLNEVPNKVTDAEPTSINSSPTFGDRNPTLSTGNIKNARDLPAEHGGHLISYFAICKWMTVINHSPASGLTNMSIKLQLHSHE